MVMVAVIRCESEEVPPGERGQIVCALKRGTHATGVYMDPPTAARFVIEDEPQRLTAQDMRALAMIDGPGITFFVRNRSDKPARFFANIEAEPDLDEMQSDISRVVERDWRIAYDRAKRNGTNGNGGHR
jgi:hypothetical protein